MDNHDNGQSEAAKIAAELEQWSSPKLGTLSALGRGYRYHADASAWLRQGEDDENDAMEEDDAEESGTPNEPQQSAQLARARGTPYRTIERVGTPVMSNLTSPGGPLGDAELPVNVQSPWVSNMQQQQQETPSPVQQRALVPLSLKKSRLHAAEHLVDYRRYYEALLNYSRGKRQLNERRALQQQQTALVAQGGDPMEVDIMGAATALTTTTPAQGSSSTSKHIKDETALELDFLRSLNVLCWDHTDRNDGDTTTTRSQSISVMLQDPARKQGNFWALVCRLRQQGLASLLWDDDDNSANQHDLAIQAHIADLAQCTQWTPQEILRELYESAACPLILLRRHSILQWLEQCMDNILPPGVTRARHTDGSVLSSNQETLTLQGLPKTGKDATLLQCALALILAGRLTDAQKLARDSGIPWRAAVWGGGTPHGYTTTTAMPAARTGQDMQETGNPRRFLWKRTMYVQADKLHADPAASDEEAAICALLSSNLKMSLLNVALRTWEHGLTAAMRALVDRTHDEVLQKHAAHRRAMQPPFPGVEHERMERDLLEWTSNVAGMNEEEAIHLLANTPYEEMHCNDTVRKATASFVQGKSAVTEFLQDITTWYTSGQQAKSQDENDESSLRFLAHVAVYLDSLQTCTTPVAIPNIEHCKNVLVSQYVELLVDQRQDLWYTIVLYASYLPDSYLLDTLPKHLAHLTSPKERQGVVEQLREFVPHLDLAILHRVVETVLQQPAEEVSTDTTRTDLSKMKAILWLAIDPAHAGEALQATNQLFRQFLAAGKYRSANSFLQEVVDADQFPQAVSQALLADDDGAAAADASFSLPLLQGDLAQVQSEFSAWRDYIEALRAFDQWERITAENAVVPTTAASAKKAKSGTQQQQQQQRLNRTERAIMERMEQHTTIQEKRELHSQIVTTAHEAHSALVAVLEHPGHDADDDALNELRARLVPNVVQLLQAVCLQTAAWLSSSLDDTALRLGGLPRTKALQLLDETAVSDADATVAVAGGQSLLMQPSPMAPTYWTQQALDIPGIVVSRQKMVYSAFGLAELKELLEETAEAATADLMMM